MLQSGEIWTETHIFSIVCKKALASLWTITMIYCAVPYTKKVRAKLSFTRKIKGNMYHCNCAGTGAVYAAWDQWHERICARPAGTLSGQLILASAARSVRCRSERFEKGLKTSFPNTPLLFEEAFASVYIITYFLTDFVNILYNYRAAANHCRMHQKDFTLIVWCYSAQQHKNGLPRQPVKIYILIADKAQLLYFASSSSITGESLSRSSAQLPYGLPLSRRTEVILSITPRDSKV